jgi:hypothetical protein
VISETELRLQQVDALAELARARLRSPERERVVGILEAASSEAKRAVASPPAASDSVISNAQEKLAQAEADREEKRRPYESDPMFMYLWRRRFGTRDYEAGNLVRYLDRKVAHLIGYEAARVNYTMLMELPDRMREHVERLKQERGGLGVLDDPRLLLTLAALEQQPEIVALLQAARADPGADGRTLRRIDELHEALRNARSEPSGPE